ncbi:hypothetical protein [Arenimonas aestuarii]
MDYATSYASFLEILETTRKLQEKTNSDDGVDKAGRDLIFESMFLAAFRALENLLEDCFIYSMQGIVNLSGSAIPRHASPTSRRHAREMLMGAQTVLDWTTSGAITRRFETFLQDKNSGLYLGVVGGSSTLSTAKDLRNHIAHNSDESGVKYVKVVGVFYPTPPLTIPTPGHLLQGTPSVGPAKNRQVLTYFREQFISIAKNITAAPP